MENIKNCDSLLAALFTLNKIMRYNNINYVITGTIGLALLGIPQQCMPNDIDIVAFNLTGDQKKVLETLQRAYCYKKTEEYKDSACYTIEVLGVKVNVIAETFKPKRDTEFPGFPEYTIFPNSVAVNIMENEREIHLLKVMPFEESLRRKMKLNRFKDKQYMLDLIKNLASI